MESATRQTPLPSCKINLPSLSPPIVSGLPLFFFGLFGIAFGDDIRTRDFLMWGGGGALGFTLLLALPRIGIIEVDPAARTVRFQESIPAAMFHPWKSREDKATPLEPGSVVTIGTWEDDSASVTTGIRVDCHGKTSVLLASPFSINGRAASELATALGSVEGISTRLVALDADYKEIPWNPRGQRSLATVAPVITFGMIFSGFFVGSVTKDVLLITGLGILLGVLYAVLLLWSATQGKTEDADEKRLGFFRVGFSVFQFWLMYGLLAIIAVNI